MRTSRKKHLTSGGKNDASRSLVERGLRSYRALVKPRFPSPAGAVLAELVARLEFRDRLHQYSVFPLWSEVVGRDLARRTEPLRIEDGKLFVRVDGSVWMQEIQFLKNEIRDRLNQRAGAQLVREIFLVVGRVRRSQKAKQARELHPVDEAEIAAMVPSLGRPELEAALRRVARARGRRLGSKS
jgi:hypothetical protein